jgi:hypothetical protein
MGGDEAIEILKCCCVLVVIQKEEARMRFPNTESLRWGYSQLAAVTTLAVHQMPRKEKAKIRLDACRLYSSMNKMTAMMAQFSGNFRCRKPVW